MISNEKNRRKNFGGIMSKDVRIRILLFLREISYEMNEGKN